MEAELIILAFDDGTFVPQTKSITQRKRREKLIPLVINEWPAAPPQPWNLAMANSSFKAKVIEWIVKELPAKLQLRRKDVIIDWNGDHYQHITYIEPDDWWLEQVPREVRLGEADVKFSWWAKLLRRPMAVISIDGDYVPIAMTLDVPICIWRQSWIDIQRLKSNLKVEINDLIFLIGLTGTDFSRQLPWIKPKFLFPLIRQLKLKATTDMDTGMRLVAAIYAEKFKRFNISKVNFESTRSGWLKSKMSDSIKTKLPSTAQVETTLLNTKFVLEYWTSPETVSNDIEKYGFKYRDGQVVWNDTI